MLEASTANGGNCVRSTRASGSTVTECYYKYIIKGDRLTMEVHQANTAKPKLYHHITVEMDRG